MIFEKPCQVVFADPDEKGWLCGIAYGEEIICGCCGSIFEIADIVEAAMERGCRQAIYPYDEWIDITEAIAGGELPEGLDKNDDYETVEAPSEEELAFAEAEAEEAEYEAHYFKNLE